MLMDFGLVLIAGCIFCMALESFDIAAGLFCAAVVLMRISVS